MKFKLMLSLLALGTVSVQAHAQTFGCTPPMANDIVCENSKMGNSPSEWDISGNGDPTIQGFSTDISVNQGQPILFKINTNASAYHIDVYRIGYYNGLGARKVATVNPSVPLPQTQPNCLTNAPVGLFDCGNWNVSASWNVPANAPSGIYIARLVRNDTGGASHILFIVRNDASHSNLLFKTSDTTYQAYNFYGGSGTGALGQGQSLYGCQLNFLDSCRAFKVSYNRPLDDRGTAESTDWFFNAEYPMVRFLEANGYDVTYISSVDADRNGSLLLQHKVVLPVGHDEYWSANERSNFAAARAAGVNLAFFSGNDLFWKVRWEDNYRTLVSYKETKDGTPTDPTDPPTWTGTWRDPRYSPPSDGGFPENQLLGNIFTVNGVVHHSIVVPQQDGRMRFWRNTQVAALGAGQSYTFPTDTLGFEWNEDLDNGVRPPGLFWLSTATLNVPGHLVDYGNTFSPGVATHHLTLYRHPSGARVFGAGTVQWSFGLDANHDNSGQPTDVNMQQATVNLFADMGVQPATLQPGLSPATASTDQTPPTSIITSPSSGSTVPSGTAVTVQGTASDAGGGVVGAVEVSVNGGASWHRAVGRQNWSYTWTPTAPATYTIKSRAVDDSGNLETPSAGVNLNVTAASGLQYTITFDDLTFPGRILDGEYPTGVINWGVGGWLLAAPFGGFTTQSTSFDNQLMTSATVAFLGRFALLRLDADNGGTDSTTLTFSCQGVPTVQAIVPPGQIQTINTGWTDACSPVTIASSNGWNTNFKNLLIEFLGGAAGPLISNIAVDSVTTNSARVTWTTNVGADSQVEYGLTTSYGNFTPLNTLLVTSHAVQLSGLTPGTLYHARVRTRDSAGNLALSGDFTFTTVSVPLTISNVAAGPVGSASATITWTTNLASSSQVDFGTTASYGNQTALDSNQVTSHSVQLTGLTANTLYHYRVRSNSTVSGDFTFTTQPSSGGNPPVISNITVVGVTSSGATITWSTNVPSTTQVEYGLNTSYGNMTPLDSNFVTSHSKSLTGLTTGTLYHYRVRSTDSFGNLGISTDGTFATSSTITVTFDDISPPNRVLSGQYPTGVIDWGSGTNWWLSVPYGLFTGQSVTFNGSSVTSASFAFVGNGRLVSLQAYNGGSANATLTISCPGQTSVQVTLPAGQISTVSTAWSNSCTPVTLSTSNGWFTNFKNLVVDFPSPPPVISNAAAGSLTSTGATIGWTTDVPATSQVEYGTSTAYGTSTTLDTNLVTSHSVALTGLSVSTSYHYRVRSTNASGNAAVSGDFVFTTLTSGGGTPPVISNVAAGSVTTTGATISWTTNVPATSQVEYGTTPAYGTLTTLDTNMVTNHSVVLTGLAPATQFHYRVRSANSGNLGFSGDFTFATLSPLTSPTNVCQQASSDITGVTSRSCTGSVTNGSAIILFLFGLGLDNATNLTATDSAGDSISLVPYDLNSSRGVANDCAHGCTAAFLVFSTRGSGAVTFNVNWSGAAQYASLIVEQWTGHAADPWDGWGYQAVSNAASPISATANGHNTNTADLVVAICATNNNNPSPGAGFTVLNAALANLLTIYQLNGAGNATASCTYSGTDNAQIEVLTLRAAGTYPGIIRRQASSSGGINIASCRIDLVTTAGNGSMIYAQAQINGAAGYSISLTDSGGHTWTNLFQLSSGACFNNNLTANCRADYLPNAPAGITSITYTFTPTDNGSCSAVEYLGLSAAPLDQAASPVATASSPFSSNPVTTTTANEVLVGAAVSTATSGVAILAPSGPWTLVTSGTGVGGQSLISERIVSSVQTNVSNTGTVSGAPQFSVESSIFTFK